MLNSHFFQLRETLTLSKEETDLIAPGGWNAEQQLVSPKVSLEMDESRRIGSQRSLGPEEKPMH